MHLAKKRGLSPVIATTLLILMAVVLATIIFLWARSFIAEKVQKDAGNGPEVIEQLCKDVSFDADAVLINGNTISIDLTNKGNIPIHGVEIRKKSLASLKIIGENIINVPENGISSGETRRSINIDVSNKGIYSEDNIIIAPVLLGTEGSDEANYKSYACPSEFGVETEIS